MTSRLGETFRDATIEQSPKLGVYGAAVGLGAGLCAVVLLIALLFAVGDSAREATVFAVVGAVCAGLAWQLSRREFEVRVARPVPALTGAVVCYLFVAAVSTVVYLASGAIGRVDDAVYESVTGVATSALTLFEDPQFLGPGVLVWRSGTQWIGGLVALALTVGILPFLGGSRELADPRSRGARRLALANRPVSAVRRVSAMYAIVTVAVCAALMVAGMGLVDAVSHALSSVSTGGFSTHADSIGHFDSRAIEIVMIMVMAGAGFSLVLVWMLWRRQFQDTLRVFELRIYGLVLVGASAWVWWLVDDSAGSGFEQALDSTFTVVSLSTTTGHRVSDWGSWHPGAEMMLLFLLVIGGMAGSVSAGLKWIRVVGLSQFVWRELQRQLHPRAVRSVKVGGAPISEESVERWHAQLVLTMLLAGTGAVALAFFGSDILEALTLALSAVSTTGPALAEEGGTLSNAASLSRADRATLMPLMLAGRVAVTPAFVAVGAALFGAHRRASALMEGAGRP